MIAGLRIWQGSGLSQTGRTVALSQLANAATGSSGYRIVGLDSGHGSSRYDRGNWVPGIRYLARSGTRHLARQWAPSPQVDRG
ncbi:unnamed protein product [Staurois parvus]|uniref:Uncharacterized protein n=1 Tax=Staurois parvus TaxID=386267 RepID=A0ABN9G9R3_9NEOB|nr:unnamed protein product [Staurois parvus]